MDSHWKPIAACLDSFYQNLTRRHPNQWVIGFSGGMDSTALLYALNHWIQTSEYNIQLSALHINHQLHDQATALQQHCVGCCEQLSIPLTIKTVSVGKQSRYGLEAQARRARFAVISEQMNEDQLIFLAHHQLDQAETFMLNTLRGSDINALGSMKRLSRFRHFYLARPWLSLAKPLLKSWVEKQSFSWVEDPTNQDMRLTRNFLRHEILNRLSDRDPAYISLLARSATRCAEANDAQEQFAETWIMQHCQHSNRLPLRAWRVLPCSMQVCVLKRWLLGNMPANAQLNQLLTDARSPNKKGMYCWQNEQKESVCFLWRDHLFLYSKKALEEASFDYELPDAEDWLVKPAQPLSQSVYFQGKQQTVKHILKVARVLPWWRQRIKLLYKGSTLIMVGDLAASDLQSECVTFKAPQVLCL